MTLPIAEQQDSFSDYGSDFTPDEEEILNGLLQSEPLYPGLDSDLCVKDIEDEEYPRGAKVPALVTSQQQYEGINFSKEWQKKSVTIQIDGDDVNTANNGTQYVTLFDKAS